MDAHHLVQMANRIGDFFVAIPDRDEALEGVASHLQKFWEPRMRRELLRLLDDPTASTPFHPLVREALLLHRDRLGSAR